MAKNQERSYYLNMIPPAMRPIK